MSNRIWVAVVAAMAALLIAMPATATAGKGERKAAAANEQLLDKLDKQLENLQAAVTSLSSFGPKVEKMKHGMEQSTCNR